MSVNLDQLAITAIRTLSIDMIDKANSGHPGLPMGAAPMAYELWAHKMKHNPSNPKWFDRDRFVLSAGHGSALLYSLLHLFGYDLPLDQLKQFRQWGSKTPGHPEYGHTPGVEATTGPLGQGIGMAVGMAMAEAHLAATYNRDGHDVISHYTYALCGDGDLMEGVAAEAASMAGHMGLGKLIVLYDSNDISLDGQLSMAFTESVQKRFESYGWQYLRVEEGTDIEAIGQAIEQAQADANHPTLIEIRTIIGFGSPNRQGTNKVHGSPLGAQEAELTKKAYNWEHEAFEIPQAIYDHYATFKAQGEKLEAEWHEKFSAYEKAHPELAKQLKLAIDGELPSGWDAGLPAYTPDDKAMATRETSGAALNGLAKHLPTLFGGSADLAGSNNTTLKGLPVFDVKDYSGRNVWFGVREHAMGAALNGLALHGGIHPYGGTFFVFSDYLRPSIRLAALMGLPVIYVLTHDSIAVGEDGPTHEPVEHLAALRVIPNLTVLRPADGNETNEAYRWALTQHSSPVAMVLTRQKLPQLPGTGEKAREGLAKGAYVLADAEGGAPQVILIATGSEVSLAMEAKKALDGQGVATRVVSMPAVNLFEQQDQAYKDSVLPPSVKARVALEMGVTAGWHKYVGDNGAVIGIDTFGASAPGDLVMKEYGFTVDNVVQTVQKVLG
ncbi:transketolase [Tumebacillus flagellatus]|uniref:Transketolase n=1 Tax=Tumebacillus flagellatus TaxID=1157490 RepID=A0A074LHB7_9BACL|nr:transketolase [Tumebacillus flagellatus]KEO81596.1 transketolase [Tumebacillus flagellatus]